MNEKVDNFEDAKIVIKNAPESNYFKHRLKVTKLRGLFSTAISAVAATTAGLISGNPALGMIIFPLSQMVLMPAFFPYIALKNSQKLAKNDDYLNSLDEKKVIDIANGHIEQSNEYEEKEKEKHERSR